MKELSIEEKAKAYDEALKILHKYDGANIMFTQDLKEEMFPELKESEDEKTKRLLHTIANKMSKHLRDIFTEEEFQCFDAWSNAWLEKQGEQPKKNDVCNNCDQQGSCVSPCPMKLVEKQGEQKSVEPQQDMLSQEKYSKAVDECVYGEQKPADKVVPKFKVGDKVKSFIDGFECTIESIDNICYYGDTTNFDIQDQDGWELVEHKPIDKFKVGKWYQCTEDFFGKGVTFDKNTAYYCAKEGCLQNEYGCHIAIDKKLYDNFKLWTIQDAKDGDVLAYPDGSITLFKYMDENIYMAHVLWVNGHIELNNSCAISNVHPATKEQRDLLFQKMKESGYEWDGEKKELKKIEQTSADETPYPETLEKAIDLYYYSYGNGEGEFEHLSLEKFRDIVHTFVSDYGQKLAWSEEDIMRIDNLIAIIENRGYPDYVEYLEKLKDRVLPQPQQEWSEEDERMRSAIWNSLDMECLTANGITCEKVLDWIDSLKDRVQAQSHWKPSDQELGAMLMAIGDEKQKGSDVVKELRNIYQQLKKLREE